MPSRGQARMRGKTRHVTNAQAHPQLGGTPPPEWTLQQAAETMVRAGFRHLVVIEGQEVIGLLSMRDIVRVWAEAATPVAQVQAVAPA